MGPIPKCELCGSTEDLDFYAGGPVGCMCNKCKAIVLKFEEAKKAQKKHWDDIRASRSVVKE